MIALIIKLGQLQDYYGVSENVEIFKGKNEMAFTWKQVIKHYRRWLKK
jgi:hypothetical protein